jgi:hypothetical protein
MPVQYTFADIVRGASINQLAELFELDRRTVTDRLRDLKPCGTRSTFPIYKVREASALLLERYVYNDRGELVLNEKRKQESDKDYWDGQLKKQKYEENAGDLWRTEKVVVVVSEILKLFRESVTVFIDSLEYDSGLPAAQVAQARVFGDNLLATCRQKLLELQADTLEPETPDTLDQGSDEEDFSDLGL